MADRQIEVETVAAVPAVYQQAIKVAYHAAQPELNEPAQVVLTYQRDGWGDLQFVTFPADKAEALIGAIRAVISGEGDRG